MEESPGTDSRGASRELTSAGAGVDVDPRRQPHLSNPTQTLHIALLSMRDRRRGAPNRSLERAELRPDL
jgi:hypothetical protein